MSKMIQIRNVPEEIHRRLKSKAALAGQSLSEFLLQEVRRLAERPTLDEIWAQVEEMGVIEEDLGVADVVREMRGDL